ncbi:MAG: acetylornithine/LysW-gamma-L-lysine aminotransferase [Parasphingorhabdus sp.]|jgi:acetylornithine/LysW-gamma-L-lysine aminotransferase
MMSDLISLEQAHSFEVYPKRDICLTHGVGAVVFDETGKEYIDCVAGVGVASLGHGNEEIVKAVTEQASRLISCPGIFYNDVRAKALQRLAGIAPLGLDRAFLCNSGTEAMEAAIKFARLTTGKNGFISAMRGFHGRSMGALSATHKYRDEFEPLIPGHQFVAYNKLDKLESVMDENTAAVILELVQGEGGVRPANPDYIDGVVALCKQRGVLLIIDEIQTGFGRTGHMFACEKYGIVPDMMTIAKAMAGGLPMGAVLCSEQIASAAGKHGSTFGGNPLASAACIATIDYIQNNNLCDNAKARGDWLARQLNSESLKVVREIRQQGLMIGIELKIKVKPVIQRLLEVGVLALPAGPTVLRLLPPLVITESQIARVRDALVEVLGEFAVG